MIESTNLTKQFNGRTVVDAVTLSVSAGQIFGLLEPNVAGKANNYDCKQGL